MSMNRDDPNISSRGLFGAYDRATQRVPIHSPEAGSFQFSQSPPTPTGLPSFMEMAQGCLALCPLIAFHSKKPSTGTIQCRRR